jgi:hypothetical protein
MKLTYSPTPYQWHDGNQHHVGVMVMDVTGHYITRENGFMPAVGGRDTVLMAHSHTRELEFVLYSSLSPYPSSPIPQP